MKSAVLVVIACLLIPVAWSATTETDLRAAPDEPNLRVRPALNDEDEHVGIHTIMPIRADLPEMMDSVAAKWVRVTFYWYEIEEDDDDFDFSGYSSLSILKNHSPAKKVLAVIEGIPDWMGSAPDNSGDYDDYGELLEEIEDNFPEIDHYEVWNEAYGDDGYAIHFWPGSASDLDSLVAHAHGAVGTGNTILCCGFTPGDSTDINFIDTFADGVGSNLDVLTVHKYTAGGSEADIESFVTEVQDDNSNAYPIWVTEFGAAADGDPLDDDAPILDRVFTETVNISGWDKSFLYTFDRDDTLPNDPLLEGNASSYTTIHYASFCRMVKEAGNLNDVGHCTDDLGLNLTTLPEFTVCALTVTYDGSGFDEFTAFASQEPLYNTGDGDQYFQVETSDSNFSITITIDGYYSEIIPVTVSPTGFCPSTP